MADSNRVINATLTKYVKSLEVAWAEKLTLLMKSMEAGNVIYNSGGLDKQWQLEKTQNPNWESFGNFDNLTLNATDATVRAELEYGQYRSHDFLPMKEILSNRDSQARIYDLERSKAKYLVDSARDDLGAAFHSDSGTGTTMVGLRTALPDTNFTSKSYAGITFTGNSWFQCSQVNGDGFDNTDFETDALLAIEDAKLKASHDSAGGSPSWMLTTKTVYALVANKHSANERYVATADRKLGGSGLMVHGMEMLWDSDSKADIIYGMNSKYLEICFMTDSIFRIKREESISPAGIAYYLDCWPLMRIRQPRYFFTIHGAD